MAEFSFDVVSRVDMAEVQNAVHQARKEIETRFDFRGSRAAVDLDAGAGTITLTGDDDQKVRNVLEVVRQKLAKRSVPMRALKVADAAPAGGGVLKQTITIQQGIPADKAKAMQKFIRDAKWKVTAQIQDDQLRVSGAKKDDLQGVISALKARDFGLELQFVNYR